MPTLRLHSFQSLGTVDGPGVRAVVFTQGCPLRCACCHNPDTWNPNEGTVWEMDELLHKIRRCKGYFGKNGGVTVSGGEPLLQSEALISLFSALKEEGIHTALDTSGCILNDTVKELLTLTDLVLLDYKYTNDKDYLAYTGMEKEKADAFLAYLEQKQIRTWLRHVYIPTLNDNDASLALLCKLRDQYTCVEKIELLPFRKLCLEKYQNLGIEFPLANTPEPTAEEIARIKEKFAL